MRRRAQKLGRIGDSSFDAKAGSLNGMLDLHGKPDNKPLFLDPASGQPQH